MTKKEHPWGEIGCGIVLWIVILSFGIPCCIYTYKSDTDPENIKRRNSFRRATEGDVEKLRNEIRQLREELKAKENK